MDNGNTELRGVSFEIPDLVLLQAWSEARRLQMAVMVDMRSDTEEFEEVLAFFTDRSAPCRFIMWRDEEEVFIQPVIGKTRRYPSVLAAILASTPRQDIVLTDVTAPRWPETEAGPG